MKKFFERIGNITKDIDKDVAADFFKTPNQGMLLENLKLIDFGVRLITKELFQIIVD